MAATQAIQATLSTRLTSPACCPADPWPLERMYIERATKPGQRPSYVAIRGNSPLEGYHLHLSDLLPGHNYAEDTSEAMLTFFNFR
jgi:hypothetical protein